VQPVWVEIENNSADLYSHLWDYNVLSLEAPYTPERYIEAIKICENAWKEVIIIDSITHEWDWTWWIIEIHNKMPWNSFTNWWKVTPRHNNFIRWILESSCHIITTVRKKQDYLIDRDSNWKQTIEKVWLKEITRDWFEYELTTNFDIEITHLSKTSKDRTWLFIDSDPFIITKKTGETIKDWNLSWKKVLTLKEIQDENYLKYSIKLSKCKKIDKLKEIYEEIKVNKFNKVNLDELTKIIKDLQKKLSDNKKEKCLKTKSIKK
jgi:hypothetical protein